MSNKNLAFKAEDFELRFIVPKDFCPII